MPYLKGGKAIKALAESEKFAAAGKFIGDIADAVRGGDDSVDIAAAACKAPHSFTGDTRVLMADGVTKPIAEVKVGEKITNTEPDGKGGEVHLVTAVHVTTDDQDRVELTTASGPDHPVSTTEHHQIWEARSHHWVEAGQLQPGDKFDTPRGNLTITRVSSSVERGVTYDLTIDGVHTYYVLAGRTPVLVHNSNCPSGKLSDPLPSGMNNKIASAYDDVKAGRISSHDTYGGREHSWWAGSKEYRVPGRPETDRILEKELPNGIKVYGWTSTHYAKIQRFSAPQFPDSGWN